MSQHQQRNEGVASFGAGTAARLHGTDVVMTGRDWRAAVRLTAKDRTVLAEAGGTCERVPMSSWPWLIAQGLMVPRACTCGHADNARVADEACPVTHAALETVLDVAGITAALRAALTPKAEG